jgi:hypothetical protein
MAIKTVYSTNLWATHGFWGTVDVNIPNFPTVVAQTSLSYLYGFENSGQVGIYQWCQFIDFCNGYDNYWDSASVKKLPGIQTVTFLVWCSVSTDYIRGSGVVHVFE